MALTETATKLYNAVISAGIKEGEYFTLKQIGMSNSHAATKPMIEQGYLEVKNTTPKQYSFTEGSYARANKQKFVNLAEYSFEEFCKQMDMTYEELMDNCLDKYGAAEENYFDTNFVKNNKVVRKWLQAHHMAEDKYIMLSHSEYAKHNPYELQLAENLRYCNYLEHTLAHMKIYDKVCDIQEPELYIQKVETEDGVVDMPVTPGIGGVLLNFKKYMEYKDKFTQIQYYQVFDAISFWFHCAMGYYPPALKYDTTEGVAVGLYLMLAEAYSKKGPVNFVIGLEEVMSYHLGMENLFKMGAELYETDEQYQYCIQLDDNIQL